MSSLLSLSGVCKGFGDTRSYRAVFDGLDLDVAAGETLAVCGPSGSGKSTLLNLIAGLECVDSGSLVLRHGDQSHPLHRLSEAQRTALRRRLIGYVFQFFNLVPTLSIRENLALPLQLNRCSERLPSALRRLEALGLGDRADAFPDQLSGGEQQRAAIARALAHEPAIVLADEPTGNLDAQASARVADLLFSEAERLGCVLVVATHSADIAARAQRRLELGN